MANKQETKKRRVAAQQQADRRQAAVAKRERRRQLVVGAVVAFLALALIAPLTAGLIAGSDDEPEAIEVPTTTTIDLDWMPTSRQGAVLTGSTPCPSTDGSAERTTRFAEAPPVCIETDGVYELTFGSAAGSLTVPVDASVDLDAANLAAVLGWYHAYEETPIQAFATGLIGIGGIGDAGFLVDPTPSPIPLEERFVPGSVLATTYDGGLNGALMVVVDETGQDVLEQVGFDAVRVGTIDDIESLLDTYDALDEAGATELVLVDSVTVAAQG